MPWRRGTTTDENGPPLAYPGQGPVAAKVGLPLVP